MYMVQKIMLNYIDKLISLCSFSSNSCCFYDTAFDLCQVFSFTDVVDSLQRVRENERD